MGAEPYYYIVKHQPDVAAALEELRQREFKAGRYNPVVEFPRTPPAVDSPCPGAEHSSIREAIQAASVEGTRSILDLSYVSEEPDFGAVAPLAEEVLESLYGTTRPARETVERELDFLDFIDRGRGLYIVLYKDDSPDEILFAGYSFD